MGLASLHRRRHMNKGQRAMIAAKICFFKKQSIREAEKSVKVSNSQIAYGLVVLAHAPDLADSVIAGAETLNAAYAKAQERKREAA
jgi:hypothetical protein